MIPVRTQRVLERGLNFSRKPPLAKRRLRSSSAAEAKRFEARHEEKLKITAAGEAAAAEERSRAEAIPVSSVHTLHRFHFASRLQQMSVIVDVEAKEAPKKLRREANTPW